MTFYWRTARKTVDFSRSGGVKGQRYPCVRTSPPGALPICFFTLRLQHTILEIDFADAETYAIPHDVPFVFNETAYVTDVLIGRVSNVAFR